MGQLFWVSCCREGEMFSLLVAVDPQGRMFLTLFSLRESCVPKCSLAKWSGDVCFRSTGSEKSWAAYRICFTSVIPQPPARRGGGKHFLAEHILCSGLFIPDLSAASPKHVGKVTEPPLPSSAPCRRGHWGLQSACAWPEVAQTVKGGGSITDLAFWSIVGRAGFWATEQLSHSSARHGSLSPLTGYAAATGAWVEKRRIRALSQGNLQNPRVYPGGKIHLLPQLRHLWILNDICRIWISNSNFLKLTLPPAPTLTPAQRIKIFHSRGWS